MVGEWEGKNGTLLLLISAHPIKDFFFNHPGILGGQE
jgi:hypothetical protein